jgi:hypothetical protein
MATATDPCSRHTRANRRAAKYKPRAHSSYKPTACPTLASQSPCPGTPATLRHRPDETASPWRQSHPPTTTNDSTKPSTCTALRVRGRALPIDYQDRQHPNVGRHLNEPPTDPGWIRQESPPEPTRYSASRSGSSRGRNETRTSKPLSPPRPRGRAGRSRAAPADPRGG